MSQFNYEELIGTKIHDVELGTGTIEAVDYNSIVVEFQRKIGLKSFFFPPGNSYSSTTTTFSFSIFSPIL